MWAVRGRCKSMSIRAALGMRGGGGGGVEGAAGRCSQHFPTSSLLRTRSIDEYGRFCVPEEDTIQTQRVVLLLGQRKRRTSTVVSLASILQERTTHAFSIRIPALKPDQDTLSIIYTLPATRTRIHNPGCMDVSEHHRTPVPPIRDPSRPEPHHITSHRIASHAAAFHLVPPIS